MTRKEALTRAITTAKSRERPLDRIVSLLQIAERLTADEQLQLAEEAEAILPELTERGQQDALGESVAQLRATARVGLIGKVNDLTERKRRAEIATAAIEQIPDLKKRVELFTSVIQMLPIESDEPAPTEPAAS